MMPTALFLAALASVVISGSQGCVFLMGESPDSLVAPSGGTHWNYGFRGSDWVGVDSTNSSWACMTGQRQSPINIALRAPNTVQGQQRLRSTFSYSSMRSNGSNIQVFNNGHTVQVQWPARELQSQVLLPHVGGHVVDVTRPFVNASYLPVRAVPLQLHFHTASEHTIGGAYYPLELHIVHVVPQSSMPACPASGCLAVAGVMFALSDDDVDNPTLDSIWSVMPMREGLVNYMPANMTLNMQAMLPRNRTYVQYSGSLTTPPCSEGVLWHVFTNPVTISLRQLRAYELAVGLKECTGHSSHEVHASTQAHRKLSALGTPSATPSTSTFVRGAYSGFVPGPTITTTLGASSTSKAADPTALAMAAQLLPNSMRRLTGAHNSTEVECEVVSVGFSNRVVQPTYNRTRLVYN
ncbi:hypothetical protein QJQ45_015218 [Haematococcus lacustris]|nr:hypothetical protein QJQ45_015218 [Haematococcus lacustris]